MTNRNITEEVDYKNVSSDIELRDIVNIIWQNKIVVSLATSIITLIALYVALTLPNIYKSEVTLSPVSENSGMKLPGQLGGLAAIAGVNLGGNSGNDKVSIATELLRSRDFITKFVDKNDLYVPLLAAKGWDKQYDKIIIDNKIYSEKDKIWLIDGDETKKNPTKTAVVEGFLKIMDFNQDKNSGIIRLSIEHYSPKIAEKIVSSLVKAINEEMRIRELKEAEKSINYLNNQIMQTKLTDMQGMLYSLVEEQTKTLMLANVRDEFVFETIDPAIIPEIKHKPKRAYIVVGAFLFGFFVTSLLVLARNSSNKKNR